jgi:adenosylcobinamide kinase/adenosylcobinamide-phosphate guanylyltransferase
MRTLVLGGSRSGKSLHAEGLLAGERDVVYAATARRDPDDAEWEERIRRHRERRSRSWVTDESTALDELLRAEGPPLLVDSVTAWLVGVMDDLGAWDGASGDALAERADRLCRAWATTGRRVVAVSDEVGLGVVPETPAGRMFRDALGSLNQRLAGVSDEVHLVVAGQVLRLR